MRIENGKVRIIVYKSGKLVFNDTPETREVINSILELERGYDYILGTDEVGKGEWYGPLVVVCVALTPIQMDRLRKIGVRDSKLIKKSLLMSLASQIIKEGVLWKPLIVSPKTFNERFEEFKRENKTLNEFLAWAHSAAIKEMLDSIKYNRAKIVIDKFDVEKMYRRLYGVDETKLRIIQTSKENEVAVNVASILAKYVFEREVDKLNKAFQIDLRKMSPSEINSTILPFVAKVHFKNVRRRMKSSKLA